MDINIPSFLLKVLHGVGSIVAKEYLEEFGGVESVELDLVDDLDL